MISYNNKEIIFKGCPGCAYGKHEFNLECGMAYENDRFTLSQDWELPIQGFFIVSPKRHIEKFVKDLIIFLKKKKIDTYMFGYCLDIIG